MILPCYNQSQTKLIYFRCTCENSQILNRNEECTCCSEFPEICNKNREAVGMGEVAEAPVCITHHPGFQAVWLNRWVLQTAWYQYKQQYHQPYEGPQHKLNRHIAYQHTFLLQDLKMTSNSRVFIFQMNKKQRVQLRQK